jgi:hypothetical protein
MELQGSVLVYTAQAMSPIDAEIANLFFREP